MKLLNVSFLQSTPQDLNIQMHVVLSYAIFPKIVYVRNCFLQQHKQHLVAYSFLREEFEKVSS